MGLTTRAVQVPSLPAMKLKPRVILLFLIHKVSVKVSRRSVKGMAYRPTSKVVISLGTYWSPPRTKTLWSAKVGPHIGSNVVTIPVDVEYIWETPRTFGERFKEHLKDPSSIHHHNNHTGHSTNQKNFQIIGRKGHGLARNIKEAIFIKLSNHTLNRNIGKFILTHILDRVSLNTPGLTLKMHVQDVGHANPNTPINPT